MNHCLTNKALQGAAKMFGEDLLARISWHRNLDTNYDYNCARASAADKIIQQM